MPRAQTVRDKCFKACITSPGSSLSSGDQKCLSRCMDRYQEVRCQPLGPGGPWLLWPSPTQ